MSRIYDSRAVLLAVLVVVSAVAPFAAPVAADTTNSSAPSGMVGIPDSNIEDVRATDGPLSASSLDAYASDHAATTNVSLVTESQADAVARGTPLPEIANKRVCSTPAGENNPNADCDRDTTVSLVLSDETHHEGRTIALQANQLSDALGHVPSFVTVRNNESGEKWERPTRVEDGWVFIEAPHFSSNAVTWNGSYEATGTFESGSSLQYNLSDYDSASDPVLNLTGVLNTEYDNVSASNVADGGSVPLDVAGTHDPTGPSQNGEPTVTFAAAGSAHNPATDQGDGTGDGSIGFIGDDSSGNTYKSSIDFTPGSSFTVEELVANIGYKAGGDYGATVDIRIAEGGADGTFGEGTKVGTWDPDWSQTDQSISLSSGYSVTAGQTYEIEFITQSSDGDGTADRLSVGNDDSPSTTHFVRKTGGNTNELQRYADVTVRTAASPSVTDPGLDVDGDGTAEASYSGTLEDGASVTQELASLSTSDDSGTLLATSGAADVDVALKERTGTSDAGAELNGKTLSHDGVLAEGETVSLTYNQSVLQEGTNTLNVSVGDGTLSADAPAPRVELDYSHDATNKKSVNYEAERWTDRYNISTTFASSRTEATSEIPFENNIVQFRDLVIRWNESGAWQQVADSNYALSGNDLSVDLDDAYGENIPAGTTATVRANASKVETQNISINVVEASALGQELNTKFEVQSAGTNPRINVGPTKHGSRLHYLHSESWESDASAVVEAGGDQYLTLPNAAAGGTARVSYIPTKVSLESGDVRLEVEQTGSEPRFDVAPGPSGSGDRVTFTRYNTVSGTSYYLMDVAGDEDELVDSGTAQSPVTLVGSDSAGTLAILVGADSGSDSGDEPVNRQSGGGGDGAVGVSGGSMFVVVAVVLLTGVWFVSQRYGSGSVSTRLYLGLSTAVVLVFGLEVLSAASLVGGIAEAMVTFFAGAAGAWPLIVLVGGGLVFYWLRQRSKPEKVVNFDLGGGKE